MAVDRVGSTDPLQSRASVLLPLVVILGAASVRWIAGLVRGEPLDGTSGGLLWLLVLCGAGLVETVRR
jgi:hypothetical protein